MTQHATELLIHSLVIYRLDYGNGLLYDVPDKLFDKMQRVQNMAARVVGKASRYDQITPILNTQKKFKVRVSIRTCMPNLGAGRHELCLTIYNPLHPLVWGGSIFFKVRLSIHMRAKFGRGPTVVSKNATHIPQNHNIIVAASSHVATSSHTIDNTLNPPWVGWVKFVLGESQSKPMPNL